MTETLKTLRCKLEEAEDYWSKLQNENEALRNGLVDKDKGKWKRDINKDDGGEESRVGDYIMSRARLNNENVTVAVLVDGERENEEKEKSGPEPRSQMLIQEEGRSAEFLPPDEIEEKQIQLTENLIRQNKKLKTDLKRENEKFKNELKSRSEILRRDLIDENNQLKSEMKSDNEIFKRDLQKENDLLLLELRRENKELKEDLKKESEELKKKMRQENENLKKQLKVENEQLKMSLKRKNDLFKMSLRNESESLKLELKKEIDLLKAQLEDEMEEQMIELKERVNNSRMTLRSKTAELKSSLGKEVQHINSTLKVLQHRNKLQNFTLSKVKKKISKLLTYCQMLSPDICGSCSCMDDFEQEAKYYCDCTNITPKKDCLQHLAEGNTVNGLYTIHAVNYKTMNVFCDQKNGGWIVIQRRMNGRLVFYQSWNMYKQGFGNIEREFWIGNDNLNILTSSRAINPIGAELRIDLSDWSDKHVYAIYKVFKVDQENSNYRVHVSGYIGDAGDSFSYHNGMMFSSHDKDNDKNIMGGCTEDHRGPWWHKDCHESNLNGEYLPSSKRHSASSKNIIWRTFRGYSYSLKTVEMKIRRKV